jgi:hypothetical protein
VVNLQEKMLDPNVRECKRQARRAVARRVSTRQVVPEMCVRVTPAMEAGITDHVWEISELLA